MAAKNYLLVLRAVFQVSDELEPLMDVDGRVNRFRMKNGNVLRPIVGFEEALTGGEKHKDWTNESSLQKLGAQLMEYGDTEFLEDPEEEVEDAGGPEEVGRGEGG